MGRIYTSTTSPSMEPAVPVMVEKSNFDEVMRGNTQSAKGKMLEVRPRDGLRNEGHADLQEANPFNLQAKYAEVAWFTEAAAIFG